MIQEITIKIPLVTEESAMVTNQLENFEDEDFIETPTEPEEDLFEEEIDIPTLPIDEEVETDQIFEWETSTEPPPIEEMIEISNSATLPPPLLKDFATLEYDETFLEPPSIEVRE